MTSRATEFAVEWDEGKNLLNQKKHRVSFEEAATVLSDPLERTIDDPDHTFAEHRFISIGESFMKWLLVVSYAESGEKIRIASARRGRQHVNAARTKNNHAQGIRLQ